MTNTNHRLNAYVAAPDGARALLGISKYLLEQSSVDHKLAALVELRASQINGCAFCTIMHANDARDAGETEERLTAVAVWRDTPWFSERERIALEWAERLTDLAHAEIDDDLYNRAVAEFGERGLADLSLTIGTVNLWNRLNVPFRTPPNPHFRSKAALATA